MKNIFSNPLWFTPVILIGLVAFIEGAHLLAHIHQRIDVHGHCKQYEFNKDRYNNSLDTDDDW